MRKKIDSILEKTLIFLMSFLVFDVLWQVFSRYLNKFIVSYFDAQVPTYLYAFTDELAGFLLVWVALLGGAYATGKKEHLAIELLPSKLSDKNNKILSVVVNFIILSFTSTVLIVGGVWLVITRFYLGQVSAAMELPIGVVYSIVPVSGIITAYYVLDEIVSVFKS